MELLELLNVTISQYMLGWGSGLNEIVQEHAAPVNVFVVMLDEPEVLVASLDSGSNLEGQAETWLANRVEMRSIGRISQLLVVQMVII